MKTTSLCGWTEVKLNDRREAWFGIEPNQKTFVYVRVTDMSDNITVVNTDGVVVYTDAEAVTETMTIKRLDGADASFMVRLNGNTVKTVYNGDVMLADSDYTVAENGVITLKAGYLSTLAAGEYTIRVAYDPMGESFKSGDAPTLVGVVDGDTVQLLCGVPTFDRVTVGKGIGISFTKFALFGDDVTIGNYKLRQPAGITADIVAYLADGSEYVTESHDWINTDFVITAKGGTC